MIQLDVHDTASASIFDQADYYITVADERLAQRWERAVDQTFLQIRRFPALGSPCFFQHPHLSGLRRIPIEGFPRYLLFYRYVEMENSVEVLNVIHGARDIEAILMPPPEE